MMSSASIPDADADLGMHGAIVPQRRCRNCGAVAEQNYCPACGQTTTLHPPSVREFVHEFLGHHVAIEGPLWRTLGALIVTPGRLTIEYFAGRRARYIAPLRLYLTFSLILFALTSMNSSSLRIGNAIEVKAPGEPVKGGVVIGLRVKKGESVGIGVLDRAFAKIDALSPAQRVERVNSGVRQILPYTLILLVPVLALYLKLLYWRSRRLYGEHLVVAFHAQTTAFLAAAVVALIPDGPWGDWLGGGLLALVVVQGLVALRRVYGGGWVTTMLREALLFVVYGCTVCVVVAIVTIATLAQ